VELIVIRHPRPLGGDGICYGRSDLPVAPHELAAVHAALPALPAGAPVFSSTLRRCAGLARLLSPQPVFDARLAEMDFGAWELCDWGDIARAEVDAWAADVVHYRPGGGENVLDVATRVAAAMAAIAGCGAAHAVVVCHAGTMRLMAALAGGAPVEDAALAAAAVPHHVAYGGVLRLAMVARQRG
jgi:alpha-ribazole phosphatase